MYWEPRPHSLNGLSNPLHIQIKSTEIQCTIHKSQIPNAQIILQYRSIAQTITIMQQQITKIPRTTQLIAAASHGIPQTNRTSSLMPTDYVYMFPRNSHHFSIVIQIRIYLQGITNQHSSTQIYPGYPLVKQAKALIQKGMLGTIRKVIVEYPQGWLAQPLENQGNKQATWRTDPKKAGPSACMGDISTHAENLLEHLTGQKITQVCAELHTFVENRPLEDDRQAFLILSKGTRGLLFASQIANGEENNL